MCELVDENFKENIKKYFIIKAFKYVYVYKK